MFQNIFLERLAVGFSLYESLLRVIVFPNADVDDASPPVEEAHDGLQQDFVEEPVVRIGVVLVLLSDGLRLVDDFVEVKVGPAAQVVLTDSIIAYLLYVEALLYKYLLGLSLASLFLYPLCPIFEETFYLLPPLIGYLFVCL